MPFTEKDYVIIVSIYMLVTLIILIALYYELVYKPKTSSFEGMRNSFTYASSSNGKINRGVISNVLGSVNGYNNGNVTGGIANVSRSNAGNAAGRIPGISSSNVTGGLRGLF
jgi:hypothetical protein